LIFNAEKKYDKEIIFSLVLKNQLCFIEFHQTYKKTALKK